MRARLRRLIYRGTMKILKELTILFVLCFAGEAVSFALPFPLPGSIIGMLLLLALLFSGQLGSSPLEQTGGFFLDRMQLFLLPATVSFITVLDVVGDKIVIVIAICVITTVITFAATAYTVKAVMWLQQGAKRRDG